jgi:hypothetical protein
MLCSHPCCWIAACSLVLLSTSSSSCRPLLLLPQWLRCVISLPHRPVAGTGTGERSKEPRLLLLLLLVAPLLLGHHYQAKMLTYTRTLNPKSMTAHNVMTWRNTSPLKLQQWIQLGMLTPWFAWYTGVSSPRIWWINPHGSFEEQLNYKTLGWNIAWTWISTALYYYHFLEPISFLLLIHTWRQAQSNTKLITNWKENCVAVSGATPRPNPSFSRITSGGCDTELWTSCIFWGPKIAY